MKGVCCICRRTIGIGKPAGKRLVASFIPSNFGLCPSCLGRTRDDITRIYGPAGSGLNPGQTGAAAVKSGSAA